MNAIGSTPSPPATARLELRTRVTCPHCWEGFPPEDALWISQHPNLLDDPRLGGNQQLRFLPSRFDVEGNALDAEGFVCHELACPKCHLGVPRGLFEMTPLFFSIVGTPGCGKSYFLASMTWQLRRQMPKLFGLSFTDADPSSNRILNHYEELQFYNPDRDKVVKLAKTEEQGDLYDAVRFGDQIVNYPRPFMFSVRPLPHHPSAAEANQVARALCLYDNAGESFEPGKDTLANPVTRHLARAQAIMFLYDPTQDPRFREACRGKSNDPQMNRQAITSRQETALHEMAARVRRHAGLHQNARHQRPLIVIVTKYDAWSQLMPDLKLDEAWTSAGADRFALDLPKVQAVSKRVRDLLYEITPELVSSAEGFAQQVTFVPVSATGRSPEVDAASGQMGIRPRDVQPQWVEVPMLWTLSQWCQGLVAFRRTDAARPAGKPTPPAASYLPPG